MEYGNDYTRASHDRDDPNHQRMESTDDDTVGMLFQAAPTSQYEVYHSPDPQSKPVSKSETKRFSATIPPPSAQLSKPAILPPISTSISPPQATSDAFPTPIPRQSPPASPGFRPRLFSNRKSGSAPYQESVAWANSTQFRPTTADVPKPGFEAQQLAETHGGAAIHSKQYFREARHFREPWRAGVWTRFPWKGIGALGLVVLLTVGSAVILFLSDGTTTEGWKIGSDSVQPQVYVAVLEMIMILLTFCALAEGICITFWRRLLQGAALADIHDVHDLSFLWPAVRRTFRLQFNAVAIASMLTVISLSRGPFFQRAIVLIDGRYQTNTTFAVLGIIVSIASTIAILPLYQGYWNLGRQVSLNPLEIARAFGAPLLNGLDGNMTSSDIEMERGNVSVKYGACERLDGEKVLRVEDVARANVRAPWDGEIFG